MNRKTKMLLTIIITISTIGLLLYFNNDEEETDVDRAVGIYHNSN